MSPPAMLCACRASLRLARSRPCARLETAVFRSQEGRVMKLRTHGAWLSVILSVPVFASGLQRRDYRIVSEVVYALARIGSGDPTARQLLISALSHGEARLRHRAAEVLGFCGSHTSDVVGALTEALADHDIRVRTAAAGSLGE